MPRSRRARSYQAPSSSGVASPAIATSTERTRRMNGGVAVIGIELWLFAVLFVVADLLLLLFQATETFGTSGALWAAAVGASFVALADLASASVGLAFAAANRHPLADP